GLENLLAAAAAEVHAIAAARAKIVIAEFLPHVVIAVSHALAMLGPVLPIIATARPVARIVDIDVVVVPVDRAVPGVAAGHPASHGGAGRERKAGCKQPARDMAGGGKKRGGVAGRGQTAVDDGRIVVRHINCIRILLFNDNDLFVTLLLHLHILLLV